VHCGSRSKHASKNAAGYSFTWMAVMAALSDFRSFIADSRLSARAAASSTYPCAEQLYALAQGFQQFFQLALGMPTSRSSRSRAPRSTKPIQTESFPLAISDAFARPSAMSRWRTQMSIIASRVLWASPVACWRRVRNLFSHLQWPGTLRTGDLSLWAESCLIGQMRMKGSVQNSSPFQPSRP
jgi:hypothetical protein